MSMGKLWIPQHYIQLGHLAFAKKDWTRWSLKSNVVFPEFMKYKKATNIEGSLLCTSSFQESSVKIAKYIQLVTWIYLDVAHPNMDQFV